MRRQEILSPTARSDGLYRNRGRVPSGRNVDRPDRQHRPPRTWVEAGDGVRQPSRRVDQARSRPRRSRCRGVVPRLDRSTPASRRDSPFRIPWRRSRSGRPSSFMAFPPRRPCSAFIRSFDFRFGWKRDRSRMSMPRNDLPPLRASGLVWPLIWLFIWPFIWGRIWNRMPRSRRSPTRPRMDWLPRPLRSDFMPGLPGRPCSIRGRPRIPSSREAPRRRSPSTLRSRSERSRRTSRGRSDGRSACSEATARGRRGRSSS